MTKLSLCASALLSLTLSSACQVGDPAADDDDQASVDDPTLPDGGSPGGVVFLFDRDGDGVLDSIDVDGDGTADFTFDVSECADCDPLRPALACPTFLVDRDQDGAPEGLDWDCDGRLDIEIQRPGDDEPGDDEPGDDEPGDEDGVSRCDLTSNDKRIICERQGSQPYQCDCLRNGQLVSTCETSSTSACSIPNGNCCGF